MDIYVGIDGGGTKTEACLMDVGDGRVCTVSGPASNPNAVGWDSAVERIVGLISEGLRKMKASLTDVRHACCAVAGVDNPMYKEKLSQQLTDALSGKRVVVVSDALAALTAGTQGAQGVVLIAGTGSIALGDDGYGEAVRAGGYGYLVGDEGSGFEIGRKGLMSAIASVECRGEQTNLWEMAQQRFSVSRPIELVPIIYGNDNPVTKVASFAPAVINLAACDPVASAIVDEAVSSHLKLIKAVAALLALRTKTNYHERFERLPVVLSGGLYTSTSVLFDRMTQSNDEFSFVKSRFSASSGAVLRSLLASPPQNMVPSALSRVWVDAMSKSGQCSS